MDETTESPTAAEFAKDLAVESAKTFAATVVGVAVGLVVLAGVGSVAAKLRERKAAKTLEDPSES